MKLVEKKFRELYAKHKCYMTLELTLGLESGQKWVYYQSATGHHNFDSEEKIIDYMSTIMYTSPEDIMKQKLENKIEMLIQKSEECDDLKMDIERLENDLKKIKQGVKKR